MMMRRTKKKNKMNLMTRKTKKMKIKKKVTKTMHYFGIQVVVKDIGSRKLVKQNISTSRTMLELNLRLTSDL